jgi:hypothetical protein
MSVKAYYIPPQSYVVFNGTLKLPLRFCRPFPGAVVGTKIFPRIIFLLLGLLSSQVPLIILNEWRSILHTSPKLWGCANSKLMMSTKFVQFWDVVKHNMWKKHHVFTFFWPFMISNFILYKFQVLMLYGLWYTIRFSSLMWIILCVSKSMFFLKINVLVLCLDDTQLWMLKLNIYSEVQLTMFCMNYN